MSKNYSSGGDDAEKGSKKGSRSYMAVPTGAMIGFGVALGAIGTFLLVGILILLIRPAASNVSGAAAQSLAQAASDAAAAANAAVAATPIGASSVFNPNGKYNNRLYPPGYLKNPNGANADAYAFAGALLNRVASVANWQPVLDDQFNSNSLDCSLWRISPHDSTGAANQCLHAYSSDINAISVSAGIMTITATPQWYVQPTGYKGLGIVSDPAKIVARPYTSGRFDTLSKKHINMGVAGVIEFKYKVSMGTGLWPAVWLYSENEGYGGWSGSGEIDLIEIWRTAATGGPFTTNPKATIWFGGQPTNVALIPSAITIMNHADWHVIQFSWDGQGTFVWKLDGLVDFILTPVTYAVRFSPSSSAPLVTKPYGSYISLMGDPVVANQPYQGVYVGYNNGTGITTVKPSPAPYDSSNLFFLIVELQVGGFPFAVTGDAPNNFDIFNAGNTVDLTGVPIGPITDSQAAALGLPARPAAFFTGTETLMLDYITYANLA